MYCSDRIKRDEVNYAKVTFAYMTYCHEILVGNSEGRYLEEEFLG
jgi:hypothetical protein